MDDFPRQKLCEIITQYGVAIYQDRRRLEGLLSDLAGEYRREINVLMGAVKERVPDDLLNAQDRVPIPVLIVQLEQRLEENLGLTGEASQWAVEAWAICLGLALPMHTVTAALPGNTISFTIPKNDLTALISKFAQPYIEQTRLAWALMFDARVPVIKKLIPILAVTYIISPIGLIVDLIPVAGLLANLAIFLMAVALFNNSAPAAVVAEHTARLRMKQGRTKPHKDDQLGATNDPNAIPPEKK